MAAAQETTGTSGNGGLSPEARVRGALWGLFAADALAMPTHWFYGGIGQVQEHYGRNGITGYTKPVQTLRGSILNKSNINGGGRGSWTASRSIIGDVINHGKKDLWHPSKQIHYHATLAAGENTLEAQLVRVLMKSVVECGGIFDPDHFRTAYMEFMQRPGSHSDTYASTCHRMFFANLVLRNLPPERCPDNDQHNVDAADGLILPMVAALSLAGPAAGDNVEAVAARAAAVTRRSRVLESTSGVCGRLLMHVVQGASVDESMAAVSGALGGFRPNPHGANQLTACYLQSALPATLDMVAKYQGQDVWTALLANANMGGENVHRGAVYGLLLGANAGVDQLPPQLIDGLAEKDQLVAEIDSFVAAVFGTGGAQAARAN